MHKKTKHDKTQHQERVDFLPENENHQIVKFKILSSLREFRLIHLTNLTADQVKGIRAEDDLAIMISGDGMQSMKRGHIDCFTWMKGSGGNSKKRNILTNSCIEYKPSGCPATKRKWICSGRCKFESNFCCEYFKGFDILVCLYAFKHNHEPNQTNMVEVEDGLDSIVMERSNAGIEMTAEYGHVELISDDYVVL